MTTIFLVDMAASKALCGIITSRTLTMRAQSLGSVWPWQENWSWIDPPDWRSKAPTTSHSRSGKYSTLCKNSIGKQTDVRFFF